VSPRVQKSDLTYRTTVLPKPARGARLRYMGRQRVTTQDRNGDPLDGLVSLWVIALVLVVAFLVAALAGVGLSGVLTGDDLAVVVNPGEPNMRIIVKNGSVIRIFGPASDDGASDNGTLLGQFYRLADGTLIYVPAGATTPSGVATPMATPSPDVYPTPTPATEGGYPTPTPTPFQTSPYTPVTPGSGTPGTPGKGPG